MKNIGKIVLLISLALSVNRCGSRVDGSQVLSDPSDDAVSYGKMAGLVTGPAYTDLVDQLGSFGQDSLPHEAKSLRKLLGNVRNQIDVFAYGFSGDRHTFKALREDLDEGYETLGLYKDLFDIQGVELAQFDPITEQWSHGVRPEDVEYQDKKTLESRLKDSLEWKEQFFQAERQATYASYLSSSRSHGAADLKKKDLGKFYWGGIKLVPEASEEGMATLRSLMEALLSSAQEDFKEAMKIKTLLKSDHEEVFHDFRKRVRSLLKIKDFFPEVTASLVNAAELEARLSEVVERYGDLNDLLVKFHHMKSGNKRKKLGKKIEDFWDDLKDWQKEKNIKDLIGEYKSLF